MTEYTGKLRFVDREIKLVDDQGNVQPIKTVRILQQETVTYRFDEYHEITEWVDVPLEVE